MSRINIAVKVVLVNLLLISAAACLVPLAAFKFRYGKFSLTNDEIKKIASGIEVRQAHSNRGFNDAIKSLKQDEIYCNQPHPVIGWIDICASDEFWGFSEVTAKEKSPRAYRVLLVGGSVANYLGKSGALKAALNSRLRETGSRQSLEVFNAAVPGFKQPQQVSVINALIASGWKFDSIINISGNNEIAFVANHLFLEGYSPLLPYAHPERALMAAKMLYKPQDECKRQNRFSWHPVAQYIKIRC